jgi:hypothetical protein
VPSTILLCRNLGLRYFRAYKREETRDEVFAKLREDADPTWMNWIGILNPRMLGSTTMLLDGDKEKAEDFVAHIWHLIAWSMRQIREREATS